jgi:hypothetical protein
MMENMIENMTDTGAQTGGIVKFPAGTVFMREGDKTSEVMYIILKGTAELYTNFQKPNQRHVASLFAGGSVGEMSLFLKQEGTETAVAADEVLAFRVTHTSAYEFFRTQPKATFTLIQKLCSRLESLEGSHEKPSGEAPNVPSRSEHPAPVSVSIAVPHGAAAPSVPAQSSPPAPRAAEPAPVVTELFPEGHRSDYELPLNGQDLSIILSREQKCPMCGKTFKAPFPRESRLVKLGEDPDLRIRYKDFEPLYYSIVVCPQCWFSSTGASFSKGLSKRSDAVQEALSPYKGKFPLKTDAERDTFSIFAGYYLALRCAPAAYANSDMMRAVLWLYLERLYDDCGDGKMSLYAAGQSLKFYMEAYSKTDLSPNQLQRVCFTIGDLGYKTGDYATARRFLFEAKKNRDGSSDIRNMADMRLDDVKKATETNPEGEPS